MKSKTDGAGRIEAVVTRKEIFSLPCYYTETGRKRYINIRDYDMLLYDVYDEYGRRIKAYWYGEWWEKHFNDRNHTAFDIDCNAITGTITKCRRNMYEWEYIENYWKRKK